MAGSAFREAVKPPLFVPVFRDRVFVFCPIIAEIPDSGLQKAARAGILHWMVVVWGELSDGNGGVNRDSQGK